MNYFRQLQKPTLLLWTLYLSVAILCAQGVKLHVHGFEHEHGSSHHDQIDVGIDTGTTDHSHVVGIHLSNDITHVDHHGGVIPEVDISPDGLLKKVSSVVLTLALVAIFFTLFLPGLIRESNQYYRNTKLRLSRHYYYSPPLRAPPQ